MKWPGVVLQHEAPVLLVPRNKTTFAPEYSRDPPNKGLSKSCTHCQEWTSLQMIASRRKPFQSTFSDYDSSWWFWRHPQSPNVSFKNSVLFTKKKLDFRYSENAPSSTKKVTRRVPVLSSPFIRPLYWHCRLGLVGWFFWPQLNYATPPQTNFGPKPCLTTNEHTWPDLTPPKSKQIPSARM